MGTFFKIIKINILSLLALPLLLVATVSKLIAKALEKLAVSLGMIFLAVIVVMGFEFFKHPTEGIKAVLYMVGFFVTCFIIIAGIVLICKLAMATIRLIWSYVIRFFDRIYDGTYGAFLQLFECCKEDYASFVTDDNKALYGFLCFAFTILRFIDKLIVLIISFALPASVVCSILLVGGTLLWANRTVQKTFGIGLFTFIGKFDTFSMIYGIVLYVAAMSMIIVVLLSLGVEWFEWAQELRKASRGIASEDEEDEVEDSYTRDGRLGKWSRNGRDDRSIDEYHAAKKRIAFFENDEEEDEEIDEHDEFDDDENYEEEGSEEYVDWDSDDAEEGEYEDSGNPVSVFFAGCDTPDKLEKRYKALCKSYHPDTGCGDTETFTRMQKEYNERKKELSLF